MIVLGVWGDRVALSFSLLTPASAVCAVSGQKTRDTGTLWQATALCVLEALTLVVTQTLDDNM